MLKWLLGTIAGIIVGLVVYFTNYLGFFRPVNLVEKYAGPTKLIYKTHIGAYHKIVADLDEVSKWASDHHVPCDRTFGEFIDNPNEVEEGRLRAHCGCVIDRSGAAYTLPEGYSERTVPLTKYVSVEFEGSPAIGPMRVYPKVEEYVTAKRTRVSGPVIEMYKIISDKAMTTTYLFPIE